jgi:hypothetical protein
MSEKKTIAIYGPGETGGTTLFKQFHTILGDNFKKNEIFFHKKYIYELVLESTRTILLHIEKNKIPIKIDKVKII